MPIRKKPRAICRVNDVIYSRCRRPSLVRAVLYKLPRLLGKLKFHPADAHRIAVFRPAFAQRLINTHVA